MPHTRIYFTTENDFLTYNPWFSLSIDNKINRQVDHRINNKFPELFKQYSTDSRVYQSLLDDLKQEGTVQQSRLSSLYDEKSRCFENKMNDIITKHIEAFSDQKDFTELRQRIQDNQQHKFSQFQNELKQDHDRREAEQTNTITRLTQENKKLETRLSNLEKTFWGISVGGVLGGILYFTNK